MARYGRGQPHGPIVLRTAAVAAVVVAALAPQIHVVGVSQSAARHPARRAIVVVLHGQPSQVPDRFAPQSHVYTVAISAARRPARDADVVFLRAPQQVAAAPLRPPAAHVVSARSAAHPARDADVVFLRGRSIVPDRLPPQVTVVLATIARTALHPARESDVIVLRTAPAAPIVSAKAAPLVVVLGRPSAAHPARRAHVVQGRGQRSLVPDRLPSQITVVLATADHRGEAVHPAREADVIFLRGRPPATGVEATPAPRIHVVLARSAVHPARESDVVFLRAPQAQAYATAAASRVHVVSLVVLRGAQRRATRILFVRPEGVLGTQTPPPPPAALPDVFTPRPVQRTGPWR